MMKINSFPDTKKMRNKSIKSIACCLLLFNFNPAAYAVEKFIFIIGSDPQPWHLNNNQEGYNGDPNSSKNEALWKSRTEPTYQSMRYLDAKFVIVNGDMTEYGRDNTWRDTEAAYSKAGIPILYGLGNHDYNNNVHDCSDGINTYFDNCAGNSVVNKLWMKFGYRVPLSNYGGVAGLNIVRSDYKLTPPKGSGKYQLDGSLAYSFEYGGVHFIQLNMCPTYTVDLSIADYNIHISDSLKWLTDDINNAHKFGYKVILNYHTAWDYQSKGENDSYVKCPQTEELSKLLGMGDFIFTGHTHTININPGNIYGVRNFTSGALFNGEYFLVSVDNSGITVTAYNGLTGKPERVQQTDWFGNNSDMPPRVEPWTKKP
ncbi:hypothetical protein LG003_21330 [Photorhabdus kleinii]|uniref:Calcineurin-like phosphoesterase domain-containing protein n=1 Tax=Photorhabdus khanii TaxID=1004150 RepID=A0A7C9LDP4_9GAMM|nr:MULTISPECIES: metallophosphoesterase [Photorhabdus]MCT8345315.1 hypothetical protein [Photorhabdus kleinii]MQL50348.1 hypothetical protein [Photorhabdus khanii]